MKKGGGSESTIIIGPSKSVLVYTFHSLEYVLGLIRFRVFVPNYIYSFLLSVFFVFLIVIFTEVNIYIKKDKNTSK